MFGIFPFRFQVKGWRQNDSSTQIDKFSISKSQMTMIMTQKVVYENKIIHFPSFSADPCVGGCRWRLEPSWRSNKSYRHEKTPCLSLKPPPINPPTPANIHLQGKRETRESHRKSLKGKVCDFHRANLTHFHHTMWRTQQLQLNSNHIILTLSTFICCLVVVLFSSRLWCAENKIFPPSPAVPFSRFMILLRASVVYFSVKINVENVILRGKMK